MKMSEPTCTFFFVLTKCLRHRARYFCGCGSQSGGGGQRCISHVHWDKMEKRLIINESIYTFLVGRYRFWGLVARDLVPAMLTMTFYFLPANASPSSRSPHLVVCQRVVK
jgi:hypothetical protein